MKGRNELDVRSFMYKNYQLDIPAYMKKCYSLYSEDTCFKMGQDAIMEAHAIENAAYAAQHQTKTTLTNIAWMFFLPGLIVSIVLVGKLLKVLTKDWSPEKKVVNAAAAVGIAYLIHRRYKKGKE